MTSISKKKKLKNSNFVPSALKNKGSKSRLKRCLFFTASTRQELKRDEENE